MIWTMALALTTWGTANLVYDLNGNNGGINLCGYVSQSPSMLKDPFGLQPNFPSPNPPCQNLRGRDGKCSHWNSAVVESLMWKLIEAGKVRLLSDAEKHELQKLSICIAENDARILHMERNDEA